MEDSNDSVISKWYNSLHAKYRHQWKSYETWVTENPESVARVEGIFRSLAYVSYMFTGQEITQQVLPELVYALSNLYVFFNDNILRKALHLCRQMTLTEERLIKLLTVIEHIEVFLELAGTRLAGRTGRWIIIASVHILRVILRLVLLFKYSSGIQPVPPLTTLKRDPKSLQQSHLNEPQSSSYSEEGANATFTGQRSGRVIRTLDAAPDINHRSWRLPDSNPVPRTPEHLERTELTGLPLLGEILHISRPVVHLTCLLQWGEKSWKPWLAALTVDLANLILLSKSDQINIVEEKEISRRRLLLLLYLLRSPCFDNYSKAKVLAFLGTTGRIWGLQTLSKSLSEYLPKWQKIYFYNWLQ
ncbi:peroxisomal membrane protein PEX16-like [Apostichopus japonicus]|uniref:peroxisomal membrane protein PEX16-like n=1 Tax=Stichopus japonicus TaxID=307972 RepID=UPI003AB52362